MKGKLTLSSLADLKRLTEVLAGVLKNACAEEGLLVGLSGELGGGKTTFVRELCYALGITTPVSSPTFALAHEYGDPESIEVEHWDLYRTKSEIPEELWGVNPPKTLRIVEWIERSSELLEASDLHLHFIIKDEFTRELTAEWNNNAAFGTLLLGVFSEK